MNIGSWTCHVCGKERPDLLISVHRVDLSGVHGLTEGHVTRNIRYCNDSKTCLDGAKKMGHEEQSRKRSTFGPK